jgi:anoctamin-1
VINAVNKAMYIILEYLDLSIQFGFVVLFSSAFSLAPLIALLTNFFQIRVDAQSYTKLRKRPTPVRVTSIGRWDDIFRAIALVSVITNSLQLSITSPEIEKMYYWYENGDITGYIDSRNWFPSQR